MMSELFETLPEAGDRPKPKMVFFFDEAHLLFKDAPKALLQKIEQVVKLIRSKGVGIFFITQNPKDIPDGVLAQLGNKVQHALRAYTPAEQKSAKAAAQSFRENPEFDTFETLVSMGTGEALISVLDEEGIPTVVKKCDILPPQSQMGPIDDGERDAKIKDNMLYLKYNQEQDRDSAYEFLKRRNLEEAEAEAKAAEEAAAAEAAEKAEQERLKAAEKEEQARLKAEQKAAEREERERIKAEEKAAREKEKEELAKKKKVSRAVKSVANSAAGTIGRQLGNEIGKSIGGSFGKKLGGNIGASLGRGILSTLFKS